jgi:hypothetical protein
MVTHRRLLVTESSTAEQLLGENRREKPSLVPAYVAADPAGQATLAATADTFAAIALVTNAAGNFLGWGIVVPLYAVDILTTRALPRWIGWLGLLVGLLAGWLGLLSPASSVIASISNIGFIGHRQRV